MLINNREWEMRILAGIEHLVHLLIEASYAKGLKKEALLNQAISHLRGLNQLLLKLIDGKEEHLEALIRQLFSQKLPPGFILTSFGGLKQDLDFVVQQALFPLQPAEKEDFEEIRPENEPAEEALPEESKDIEAMTNDAPEEDQTPAGSVVAESVISESEELTPLTFSEPSLADIIANFYPGEKVIKNYVFRSVSLDYFLPDRKIAFVLASPQKRIYQFHHLLLKREGITVIEVNPGELNNIRLLARHLPRF